MQKLVERRHKSTKDSVALIDALVNVLKYNDTDFKLFGIVVDDSNTTKKAEA